MELQFLYLALFWGCASAYVEMNVPTHKLVFDPNFYEEALDPELCSQQLSYLNNDTLLLYSFYDSSFRIPKGLLGGNFADYGNYYKCLDISQEIEGSTIEGKFNMIRLPFQQNITLPSLPELPDWNITLPEIPGLNPNTSRLNVDLLRSLKYFRQVGGYSELGNGLSRVAADSAFADISLFLAVCIPKTCTTQEAVSQTLLNIINDDLEYRDEFSRLPGDKQWVAADYVFIGVFTFLLCLVILSTCYDLHHTVVNKTDQKRLSKILLSFSVYTNTRRLITYNAVPGTIECIDGIRSFAMMWVIVVHTYTNQASMLTANPLDVLAFITSVSGIWITMGSITVDTFYMLSGLLLVYTTAGKMTGLKLLKNLHFFYLNRLLRMFPLLAAYVLIQASLLNWISDGPNWILMSNAVHTCRVFWWSTLLHVQNWVNPENMCLGHSWYLAIDVQLYIISPLFLFWVLGKSKSTAWVSLCAGLMLSLVGSSVFNFIMNFQSGLVMPSRSSEDQVDYLKYYYVNTLCRSSPFFVGMIYGYVLHIHRGQKLAIPKIYALILWVCAIAIFGLISGLHYPLMQTTWDNQLIDNLVNSYMRPAWALAVGWIVFACATGYGGPINWVLSLQCFKVLGRLSYGMYIVHYPLINVVNSSYLSPRYFDVQGSIYAFLSDFTLAAIVAYILTMLVDAPCSTLIKFAMGGGPRRPPPKVMVTSDGEKVHNGLNRGIVNPAYESDTYKTTL